MAYEFDLEPTGAPRQAVGESDAAFRIRWAAWLAGRNSLGASLQVGIPAATTRFAPTTVGERLGSWSFEGSSALPPAARTGELSGWSTPDSPMGAPAAVGEQAAVYAAGTPRTSYSTPGGGVIPALRSPADAPAPDRWRTTVLAATGFDTEWGTPPPIEGLAWNEERYLYVPNTEPAGARYRQAALAGDYLQAVRDATATGGWRVRWVRVKTPRPDVLQPYRPLSASEVGAVAVDLARLSTAKDSIWERVRKGEASIEPSASPNRTPAYRISEVRRAAPLSAYAWVKQKDLPVGCPYPYPYLPVPVQDYTSGRWLDPEYTPSIPLPPPYDQTPWRCGVPRTPGKPKKGGAAPEPDGEISTVGAGGGATLGGVGGLGGAHFDLEVGLPDASGGLASGLHFQDAVSPNVAARKPCSVLLVVIDSKRAAYDVGPAHAGVAARRAVFESLGCEVVVVTVNSIIDLICLTANAASIGKLASPDGKSIKLPIGSVEIYAHGGSTGPVETGTSFSEAKVWGALGLSLGGVMSKENGNSGHILLGWCNACQSGGARTQHIGGIVAGMSGHVVFGPAAKITFPAGSSAASGGEKNGKLSPFSQPHPVPEPFNKDNPMAPENFEAGNLHWVAFMPVIVVNSDKGDLQVPNDGSRNPTAVTDRRLGDVDAILPYSPWDSPTGPQEGGRRALVVSDPGSDVGFAVVSDLPQELDPHLTQDFRKSFDPTVKRPGSPGMPTIPKKLSIPAAPTKISGESATAFQQREKKYHDQLARVDWHNGQVDGVQKFLNDSKQELEQLKRSKCKR